MTWLLRPARPRDLPDLMRLAKKLDSINLPYDEPVILDMIKRSRESFAGRPRGWTFGQYLFVMEETKTGNVVGSSQILDKHGIVNRPHISFRLVEVEKTSRTTDRKFKHTCLKLEWNPEGITEIGGLILDERYRSHPDKLGKQLSYVRFLYMAMHPDKFRSEILAELLPPLDKNGSSLFWEHIGKKFTGLEYKEANTKCRTNAEFIFSLFPHTLIYTNLLPDKVRRLVGAIHPKTLPVKQMLEGIGFRFSGEVCPFDGGPHYRAGTADVTLIKRCRSLAVEPQGPADPAPALVGHDSSGEFCAAVIPVEATASSVRIESRRMKNLGIRKGQRVHVLSM